MPKLIFRLLMPILFSSFVITAFGAHEITLTNGDRITGKVISQTEETVVFETEFLGILKIASANIEKIVTDAPELVRTDAKPVEKSAKTADETPEKAVEKTTAEKPLQPASPEKDKAKADVSTELKPVPKLFGQGRYFGIADGWEGNANIGFSYTSGNSRTSTLTTGIRATKTGHRDKLTAYARSLWHSNRNDGSMRTTQNAVWGGARYDRDLNDRLFGFGSFDFERDAPKRLNFRSVVGGGVGHHTIKNKRTELDILVGAAWNHAWQVGQNTDTPEALAATVFKHRFNGRIKFQETFTFYQDITRISKYRFIFDTTLSADITKRIGWYISVGDRYNNNPIGNAKQNDFLFTTGLKWSFGKQKK